MAFNIWSTLAPTLLLAVGGALSAALVAGPRRWESERRTNLAGMALVAVAAGLALRLTTAGADLVLLLPWALLLLIGAVLVADGDNRPSGPFDSLDTPGSDTIPWLGLLAVASPVLWLAWVVRRRRPADPAVPSDQRSLSSAGDLSRGLQLALTRSARAYQSFEEHYDLALGILIAIAALFAFTM